MSNSEPDFYESLGEDRAWRASHPTTSERRAGERQAQDAFERDLDRPWETR